MADAGWTALLFRRDGDRIVVLDARGMRYVCDSEGRLVDVVVGLVDSDDVPKHDVDTSLENRAKMLVGSAIELVLPKAAAFAGRPILRGLLKVKDELAEVESPRKIRTKKPKGGNQTRVTQEAPRPAKRPVYHCLRPGARGGG